MGRFKIVILEFGILLCAIFSTAHGIPSGSCMIAYNEGGAPAVFQSLECTHLVLLAKSFNTQTGNCHFASIQGHREYQEDRATCNLDIKIPIIDKEAVKEAKLDVLAIFDGHGGEEASEMANQKLVDYFLVNVVVSAFKKAALDFDQHDFNAERKLSGKSIMPDLLPPLLFC